MTRIIDGIPEPGRHITNHNTVEKHFIEKSPEQKIDVDAIADAVIKAMGRKMDVRIENTNTPISKPKDDFDDSNTMKKLAEVMIEIKNKEGNLENLGTVEKTKVDGKTDKTIDLLSKLDGE